MAHQFEVWFIISSYSGPQVSTESHKYLKFYIMVLLLSFDHFDVVAVFKTMVGTCHQAADGFIRGDQGVVMKPLSPAISDQTPTH